MALDSDLLPALDFLVAVESAYASLMQAAPTAMNPAQEPELGGRLLYVGELSAEGRALVVAGNIAGAASLAATADPAAQKQAIRDGIADFLVTSLDEALRILKNEIRKGEAVAVCVGAAPEAVEREMRERGVAPDLLAAAAVAELASGRARRLQPVGLGAGEALLAWRVTEPAALWMRKLDALAAECLPPEAGAARRWLRLAPRYVGRLAQGTRLLRCSSAVAGQFAERVRKGMRSGEIGCGVVIRLLGADGSLTDPQGSDVDGAGRG